MQKPTSDKAKIVDAIKMNHFQANIPNGTNDNYKGDPAESATAAMLFSAVDKELKWNSGFYQNKQVK